MTDIPFVPDLPYSTPEPDPIPYAAIPAEIRNVATGAQADVARWWNSPQQHLNDVIPSVMWARGDTRSRETVTQAAAER